MWLQRPPEDLVYLLGRWGLLRPTGMCTHSIPENRFSFKDTAMTAGHKRVGLSPGWKPLAICKEKKKNK